MHILVLNFARDNIFPYIELYIILFILFPYQQKPLVLLGTQRIRLSYNKHLQCSENGTPSHGPSVGVGLLQRKVLISYPISGVRTKSVVLIFENCGFSFRYRPLLYMYLPCLTIGPILHMYLSVCNSEILTGLHRSFGSMTMK